MRVSVRWVALLGLTALLAGCGGGASSTHTAADAGGAPAPTHTVHFTLAAATTPVTTSIPTTPIATVPSSISGVTLQLYSAQRTGNGAVLVVFGLDWTESAASAGQDQTAADEGLSATGSVGASSTASKVSVFDPADLKDYETYMSDPSLDTSCLCSRIAPQIGAGTQLFAALVAAPPAEDNTVDVITGLGSFGNVHLTG